MSEKNDFKMLKKNMSQGHDRLERIENVAGVGTPDVNYCIDGVEGWIEMKSSKEPKRLSSKLLTHQLSQSQKNWFLAQRNADGRGFILICTDKRWILIDSVHADDINLMTVEELNFISKWVAYKPITKPFWRFLRRKLKGG